MTPPSRTETRRRLAAIALTLFANAYAMSCPFPFAGFLVGYFGLTDDDRAAGFYAGFVMTAFMLGRMVGSFPLGHMSDRIGHRPIIELGLLSCIVPQLAFGVAPSFRLALGARFVMGLLNGIIGVSKAWIPELCRKEDQALAMSLVSGMWGVGQIAGPAVGGVLYSYGASSSVAPPQFLPSLAGAVLAALALVLVRAWLPAGRADCPACCTPRASDRKSLVSDDSAAAAAAASPGVRQQRCVERNRCTARRRRRHRALTRASTRAFGASGS